jgi:hypothetical protein
MGDSEVLKVLAERIARSRGYADFFEWPDKRQKELGLLGVLGEAMKKRGTALSEYWLEEAGKDPPDAWATIRQERVAIEFTEFVDRDMIERQRREQTPVWRDWSQEDVKEHLQAIIARKDHSGFGSEVGYWLVVHCDEPSLTSEVLRRHLASLEPVRVRGITKCALLLSYDPAMGTYPLIELEVSRSA